MAYSSKQLMKILGWIFSATIAMVLLMVLVFVMVTVSSQATNVEAPNASLLSVLWHTGTLGSLTLLLTFTVTIYAIARIWDSIRQPLTMFKPTGAERLTSLALLTLLLGELTAISQPLFFMWRIARHDVPVEMLGSAEGLAFGVTCFLFPMFLGFWAGIVGILGATLSDAIWNRRRDNSA